MVDPILDQSAAAAARTPVQISQRARSLYRHAPAFTRLLQTYRPFICPFDRLIPLVPPKATVLDVGCGAGLFLALLAEEGRVAHAVGFDSNAAAIASARTAAQRLTAARGVEFSRIDATAPWPQGRYDVVSVIDVMHHIPPHAQRGFLAQARNALSEGGMILYKDMVSRPFWRALANRLHDLLLARQWIHYVKLEDVEDWGRSLGLKVVDRGRANLFW